MTSTAPKEARQKLDDAIREYAAACDTAAEERGPFMPTGWVVAIAGIRKSYDDDDETGYLTESMAGQSWHAGLGLWQLGYDANRWSARESDGA